MNKQRFYHINSKINSFFKHAKRNHLSLSYSDIRLIPQYSAVHPSQINLETMLTKNISMSNLLLSAAMDRVTESEAAIVMSKTGNIGVLHKNFSGNPNEDIELQVKEAAKVKHHLHGMISDPIGFSEDKTLGELLEQKERKEYKFDSFIIYHSDGSLAGLITNHVVKYNRHKPEQKLKDIMINDVVTRKKCSINSAYKLMLEREIGNVVLVDKRNKVTGMYTFTDVENIIKNLNPHYTVDSEGRLRVGAGVGMNDIDRVDELVKENVDVIVLDSAHGDCKPVIAALKAYKKKYPGLDIIAGNVSTGEATKRLIQAGADAIKVGQGPGDICDTRIIAGIGVMQPDAIYRCAEVASKYFVPVIADGGIKYSGDIPIAIACGASTVMIGSMLAGCKESPGRLIFRDGNRWKEYRGMGSLEAMSVKSGSDRYQKQGELSKLVPEGISKLVSYKGPLEDQIFMLLEGTKDGFGYCGSKNIEQFRKKAQLHRITPGGVKESHPNTEGMINAPANYKG